MIEVTREEIFNDDKKLKKARRAKWMSDMASLYLSYMAIMPWTEDLQNGFNIKAILFAVDGVAYWILYFAAVIFVDAQGIFSGSLLKLFLVTYVVFLVARVLWRLSIKLIMGAKQRKLFDELHEKYIKIKNERIRNAFKEEGYEVLPGTASQNAALENYFKVVNDSTRTIKPLTETFFGFGRSSHYLYLAIKAYRDYGHITINKLKKEDGGDSDKKRFLTGISIFDREYEVQASDDIKAKSFLSTTFINTLIEKKETLNEIYKISWLEESPGISMTVNKDVVETTIPEIFILRELDFSKQYSGIQNFMDSFDRLKDDIKEIDKKAVVIEKMIRSENA